MSRDHAQLSGLYAITDSACPDTETLCRQVAEAIAGGARLVQYRDKSSNAGRRLKQVRALVTLCRGEAVTLIINDDVALAAECDADGVHLGREDTDPAHARRTLGDTAIIGVSCYDQLSRAARAVDAGADYLAYGRFFPSATKPGAVQADIDLIAESKRRWALPVAAIGGITPDNAAPLLAAGADMLAAVEGVFAAPDIREAARAYARLFADTPS